MTEKVTYRKNCDCEGETASGPRFVTTVTRTENGGLNLGAKMVARACDKCDTPWVRAECDDDAA